MSQFNFNMMDAAGYGFYRVWAERSYLLKLAMFPFLIKLGSTIAVFVLGLESDILRQGLVLLPGVIAEGWVLSQFLRTLLKNERWPTALPQNIDEGLLDRLLLRARGIIAATIAYTLIGLISSFVRYIIFGFMFGNFESPGQQVTDMLESGMEQAVTAEGEKATIHPLLALPMLGLLGVLFWAYRLAWVYIAFSVLMPVRDYLRAVGGLMASAKMMILFFCTMTPVMFIVILLSRVIFNAFGGGDDGSDDIARFIMIFVSVIAEMGIALVTTTAFVFAMKDFLPKTTDLLKDVPKAGQKK